MKYFSIIVILTFFLSVNAGTVQAETVLRMSDSISLSVNQIVDGDFYGFSFKGPVALSGTVTGDVEVVGSSITLNGTINGDLFALGGTTQVHASVTDDVRIVSGETTIAGLVGGDVIVLGGTLVVLTTAKINGNIYFYGGNAEINGIIDGSVLGSSDALRIDGPVGGDVDVVVSSQFTIGDKANINGNLTYKSSNELIRGQKAIVVGNIVRNSQPVVPIDSHKAIAPFLIYAFTALIIYAMFRRHLQTLFSDSIKSTTKMGLIGMTGIIFLPISVVLMFVTIIGIMIGLISFTLLFSLFLISFACVGIFTGSVLSHIVSKSSELSLIWVLSGIILTELLFLIPLIGPFVILIMTSIIFGTFIFKIYSSFFKI